MEWLYVNPPALVRNGNFTTYSLHLEWQNIQFVSQTACAVFFISKFFLCVCVTHLHVHTIPILHSCFITRPEISPSSLRNVTTSFLKINYQHPNENSAIWQHVKKLFVSVKKITHIPSAAVTMATGNTLIDNSSLTSRRGDARILAGVLRSLSCGGKEEEQWIRSCLWSEGGMS